MLARDRGLHPLVRRLVPPAVHLLRGGRRARPRPRADSTRRPRARRRGRAARGGETRARGGAGRRPRGSGMPTTRCTARQQRRRSPRGRRASPPRPARRRAAVRGADLRTTCARLLPKALEAATPLAQAASPLHLHRISAASPLHLYHTSAWRQAAARGRRGRPGRPRRRRRGRGGGARRRRGSRRRSSLWPRCDRSPQPTRRRWRRRCGPAARPASPPWSLLR